MTKTQRSISRRDALALTAFGITILPSLGCTSGESDATGSSDFYDAPSTHNTNETTLGASMQVYYLEIVTKDVDASCGLYSAIHGVTFGDADQSLGGARTSKMLNGGMIGIRAPMHDGEKSVTRAYMLVKDIEAAVAAAKVSGAEIAVPPMKLPGHGTCAIYIQDGIEAGLWQL
jgi:uncharacterized protein